MRKPILSMAVLLAVFGLLIAVAPPASAYQLAPNSNVHRIVHPSGATSSDAMYGTYGVPYAKQTLLGPGVDMANSFITLTYVHTVWGTIGKVTCQHGYTGPSLEPNGWCQWTYNGPHSSGEGTTQATYLNGSGFFAGFGMRVQSRVNYAATVSYNDRSYSALG